MKYDLVLTGGHVIDPSQGLDGPADVAFASGKVAAIGPNLGASGADIRDVGGRYIAPGFIDLHTHVYWGGTSLSVDGAHTARQGGVTTLVDAGSAGPGNFAGFHKHVIEPSEPRIFAFLHISFAGIFAFSKRVMVGESQDMRLMSPDDAIAVAREHPDSIVGIKVRIGLHTSGEAGLAPLDIALRAAEKLGLPVMAHIDDAPPTYEEAISGLRPGDVLTHCFRPLPNAPITADGKVKAAVREARRRGVLLDIGHGMGSFSFQVARRMFEAGFPPDTISSDVHILNVTGPVFDQATTLSKFLHLGMPLCDVIRATTVNAATAIRRPELGTLRPGAAGDATIFSIEGGRHEFVDSTGAVESGAERIAVAGIVLRGRYWHP